MTIQDAQQIGGSIHLQSRVAVALAACQESTGLPPTAKRYQEWRKALPQDAQVLVPSLTAVVPIAYPTWSAAREASGLRSPPQKVGGSHGPHPRWSQQDCLAMVREWDVEVGGSLASFSEWIGDQRTQGRDLPSVSTIRLRLRKPWSAIVRQAQDGTDAPPAIVHPVE